MRKILIIRVYIILSLIILFGLLLVWRLYSLQVKQGERYRLEASHQYINTKEGIYDRGNIFMLSRDGSKIAVATIQSYFELAIDPRRIEDVDNLYQALNNVVRLDRKEFNKKATKVDDPYEVILKEIDQETADKIRTLELSGIVLSKKRKRYYPGDSMMSHLVGFVGFDENDKKVGRYGVERYYDDILLRESGGLYVNFFAELFADMSDLVSGRRGEGDIVLTIDPDTQVFVEKELKKTQEKWNSKMTAAIVMNPKTGEILAMSVYPSFDLNNFNMFSNISFGNSLVSGVYEMGSIVKVLTMAIGLDTGMITKETMYNDKGSVTLNKATIRNYDGKARGVVPMQEILSQSLNTGVVFIAERVGHEKMREYFIDKLKLNEETGIDLPAEARGIVNNLDSRRDLELATASFGQGVAFTPIAMIRALATIANDGYLVQPHVVKLIEYKGGLTKRFDHADQKEKVFKEETADTITQMLTKVVDDVLDGGRHKIDRYYIAAKTGTAQVAVEGGYSEDKFLHTFVGYGPSYDAQFIILLMNLEPVGARYASQTLSEPFSNIVRFLINHMDIPPDR